MEEIIDRRKEIYEFADTLVDSLPIMSSGIYRSDDISLCFELCDFLYFEQVYPIKEYAPLKKTVVRYGMNSKCVQADIRIKEYDKNFQLFLILWGFSHELIEDVDMGREIECDAIAYNIFKEYGTKKYSLKDAHLSFIGFLGKVTSAKELSLKRINALNYQIN